MVSIVLPIEELNKCVRGNLATVPLCVTLEGCCGHTLKFRSQIDPTFKAPAKQETLGPCSLLHQLVTGSTSNDSLHLGINMQFSENLTDVFLK
jgi:hypothetical protein